MKTIEEIKERIGKIDSFIKSHEDQIKLHSGEVFDIERLEYHSRRIKSLRDNKTLLTWVLNEFV